VHEADLADQVYDAPEGRGLDVVLRGLSFVMDDDRLVEFAGPIFDGLYEYRRQFLLAGRDPA
ncbi:chromate resistance protein, partial [mine drainage metagenome]